MVVFICDLIFKGFGKDEFDQHPSIFFFLLKYVTIEQSSKLWMLLRYLATNLCDHFSSSSVVSPHYVTISQSLSSENMSVFQQSGVIFNSSWTFESIRASHGITESGKFAYEFQIGSGGIMQIGFSTADCKFDPYLGQGVGGLKDFLIIR